MRVPRKDLPVTNPLDPITPPSLPPPDPVLQPPPPMPWDQPWQPSTPAAPPAPSPRARPGDDDSPIIVPRSKVRITRPAPASRGPHHEAPPTVAPPTPH